MKKVDFSDGRIPQNILRTAFPMLVAQVLSLLYSIVDRVYIGRIPNAGGTALGAVGLCFPIIIIITGFTNMFGMGGAPLFAMELGRDNSIKARAIQNTSFRLLVLTALAITAVGELFGYPLLRLFGATSAEAPVSLSYLRIYLVGTLPLMVSTGMNPYINAQGYALVGMVAVGAGAIANLILDPILIFACGMGIRGAAAATVISQFLSFVLVMHFLLGKKNDYPVRFAWSFPYAGNIIGLGISPFIMQVTNSLVQIVCNNVLMHFGGVLFVSVMTIISSVRSILDVPALAVTEGASPVISYNYGAGKALNTRKAIRIMICMVVPYTFVIWLLVLGFPGWFIRIFSADEALLEPGKHALHLYFAAFVFQSLQYSGQMVFKALNKKKQTIFFSLLRKVFLIVPFTFILPYLMKMGTDGVFAAEPISNTIGGTACFVTMLCTVLPELKRMEQQKPDMKREELSI